jgi:hypothetical protein
VSLIKTGAGSLLKYTIHLVASATIQRIASCTTSASNSQQGRRATSSSVMDDEHVRLQFAIRLAMSD